MNKITVSLQGIKAVIFDMNGTMIDDGVYHYRAFEELCKRHNLPFSREIYQAKAASRVNHDIMPNLFEKDLTEEEITQYSEEKENIYLELYKDRMLEVPGLTELLDEIDKRGLKKGIATNFFTKYVMTALEELNMSDRFDCIIGGDQVQRCKPDPEMYLKAAQDLGVEPSECLVFEDSWTGVTSAKAAGMRIIGLTTSQSEEQLKEQGVEVVVPDFTSIAFI